MQGLLGQVGAADQRAADGTAKMQLVLGKATPGVKLLGRHHAGDGPVLQRRLKILAQRDDVHAGVAQVTECLANLVLGLADSEHESGLDEGAGAAMGGGMAEDGEAGVEAGDGAQLGRQAADGLDVVSEDAESGFEDGVDGGEAAMEVGDEEFDGGVWAGLADGSDDGGEMVGAAVGEVVAGDHGDDDVAQLEGVDTGGDVCGLVVVGGERSSVGDGAEAAVAGTGVAEGHEGGGASFPAVAAVGALGAFADGVEAGLGEHSAHLEAFGGADIGDAEPVGLV